MCAPRSQDLVRVSRGAAYKQSSVCLQQTRNYCHWSEYTQFRPIAHPTDAKSIQ